MLTLRLATTTIPVLRTPGGEQFDKIEPGEVVEVFETEDPGHCRIRVQSVYGFIKETDTCKPFDAQTSADLISLPVAIIVTVFDDIYNNRLTTAGSVAEVGPCLMIVIHRGCG